MLPDRSPEGNVGPSGSSGRDGLHRHDRERRAAQRADRLDIELDRTGGHDRRFIAEPRFGLITLRVDDDVVRVRGGHLTCRLGDVLRGSTAYGLKIVPTATN